MSRLLLLVAIIAAVYWLIKSYLKNAPEQNHPVAEDMVRCAYCGVHLPKGESIPGHGQVFCCAAHRDAHRP